MATSDIVESTRKAVKKYLAEESENFDVDGVAAFLHRTPAAVYRMVARKQLPYRKCGKRLIFKRAEIEALLDALPGVTLDEILDQD